MSKSKKKKEKEGKEEKGFTIPPFPDFIFVVELEDKVLMTSESITECVFPYYRFDTTTAEGCDKAFKAAENIANTKKCNVVDAVNFNIDDPYVYNPITREANRKLLIDSINVERAKLRESWDKLDAEKTKESTA